MIYWQPTLSAAYGTSDVPEILEVSPDRRCPHCLDTTPSLHVHLWYRDRNTGQLRGDYDGVHYDLQSGRSKFAEFFKDLAERHPELEPVDKHLSGTTPDRASGPGAPLSDPDPPRQ